MLLSSKIREIQDTLAARNLLSISTIPIPPSSISPIRVFLLIISFFFHKKLKMSFVTSLKNPLSGLDNIKALYTSFDIANVLTTVHLPNIVKFLLFQTLRIRSNFSNLLVIPRVTL